MSRRKIIGIGIILCLMILMMPVEVGLSIERNEEQLIVKNTGKPQMKHYRFKYLEVEGVGICEITKRGIFDIVILWKTTSQAFIAITGIMGFIYLYENLPSMGSAIGFFKTASGDYNHIAIDGFALFIECW